MPLSAQQLAQANARRKRLIKICEALPESTHETAGTDHLSFKIRKQIFAYYLFDHHGDGMIAFACKSTLNEQRRLVRTDPETFFVPAYVGPRGGVGIRLDAHEVDWETVTDLAQQAYLACAPRKLASLLQ